MTVAADAEARKLWRDSSVVAEVPRISSADFKDRAQRAYAVLVTGEGRRYGNILLRKGTVKAK
jgi:L-fucose mutarotase/ribose pyranase (RbsD/FucU family)